MSKHFDNNYPKEPIESNNLYYRCRYCKISEPQINGLIEDHQHWCEWRIKKLAQLGLPRQISDDILSLQLEETRAIKGIKVVGVLVHSVRFVVVPRRKRKGVQFKVEYSYDFSHIIIETLWVSSVTSFARHINDKLKHLGYLYWQINEEPIEYLFKASQHALDTENITSYVSFGEGNMLGFNVCGRKWSIISRLAQWFENNQGVTMLIQHEFNVAPAV